MHPRDGEEEKGIRAWARRRAKRSASERSRDGKEKNAARYDDGAILEMVATRATCKFVVRIF